MGEAQLATIVTSTKITHLLKILSKEIEQHKFIVFSQFTSMLDLIEPFLRQRGFKFTRYDGSMRNDMREASLSKLRNDKNCRVLLCSLKCGSLGLNLTAASRVVLLEPFWNPFVEEQAIDRVHRLNHCQHGRRTHPRLAGAEAAVGSRSNRGWQSTEQAGHEGSTRIVQERCRARSCGSWASALHWRESRTRF